MATKTLDQHDEELEKSAIRDCLEQLWTAYRRGDPKAIADLYHPNANLVLQGQEVAVGQLAIEREYTRLLTLDPVRPDTRVQQALRIHLVRADLAVVDAAARLTKIDADGKEEKLGEAFFTIMAVKEAGRWRLAAVRGASADNSSAP